MSAGNTDRWENWAKSLVGEEREFICEPPDLGRILLPEFGASCLPEIAHIFSGQSPANASKTYTTKILTRFLQIGEARFVLKTLRTRRTVWHPSKEPVTVYWFAGLISVDVSDLFLLSLVTWGEGTAGGVRGEMGVRVFATGKEGSEMAGVFCLLRPKLP